MPRVSHTPFNTEASFYHVWRKSYCWLVLCVRVGEDLFIWACIYPVSLNCVVIWLQGDLLSILPQWPDLLIKQMTVFVSAAPFVLILHCGGMPMPGLHVSEDSTLGCRAAGDKGTCFWWRAWGLVVLWQGNMFWNRLIDILLSLASYLGSP